MSSDRTVLRPSSPKFSINETVYILPSAKKGFIEAVVVVGVKFEPSLNEYMYTVDRRFQRTFRGQVVSNEKSTLKPIDVREALLGTLCEVLPVRLSVLERELAEKQKQLTEVCAIPQEIPVTPQPLEINGLITPVAPRFGFNEVVYLIESAEALGRLESYRIDNLTWDTEINQWVYSFTIRPRPGKNMPVGDRDDMTRTYEIKYEESALCKVCEALPLIVTFLQTAVDRDKARLAAFCPSITDETV